MERLTEIRLILRELVKYGPIMIYTFSIVDPVENVNKFSGLYFLYEATFVIILVLL